MLINNFYRIPVWLDVPGSIIISFISPGFISPISFSVDDVTFSDCKWPTLFIALLLIVSDTVSETAWLPITSSEVGV